MDYSESPEAVHALVMAWFFYISKFLDMTDSAFFVLRKKFCHLSFLHVFHHSFLPFQTWWTPRSVKERKGLGSNVSYQSFWFI